MKALISKIQSCQTGYRVAQIVADDATFPVAENLEWVECADNVVADQYWFDPLDNTIKIIPDLQENQQNLNKNQPISTGSQTL